MGSSQACEVATASQLHLTGPSSQKRHHRTERRLVIPVRRAQRPHDRDHPFHAQAFKFASSRLGVLRLRPRGDDGLCGLELTFELFARQVRNVRARAALLTELRSAHHSDIMTAQMMLELAIGEVEAGQSDQHSQRTINAPSMASPHTLAGARPRGETSFSHFPSRRESCDLVDGELVAGVSQEDEEDGNLLARSNLEAKPILMHGVAPHMCDTSPRATLLDREGGGRSPALPLERAASAPVWDRAWYVAFPARRL